MKKGDIVLIPFPFTDLSGSKNRPVLVLVEDHLDVTVAFISGQIKWQASHDLLLTPSPQNGLKKVSLVRTNKLATLNKGLVLGLLGSLAVNEMAELDQKLLGLFQIDAF